MVSKPFRDTDPRDRVCDKMSRLQEREYDIKFGLRGYTQPRQCYDRDLELPHRGKQLICFLHLRQTRSHFSFRRRHSMHDTLVLLRFRVTSASRSVFGCDEALLPYEVLAVGCTSGPCLSIIQHTSDLDRRFRPRRKYERASARANAPMGPAR